jgi:hypothetical protein
MVSHGHFACIEQLFAQSQTNYSSKAKEINESAKIHDSNAK